MPQTDPAEFGARSKGTQKAPCSAKSGTTEEVKVKGGTSSLHLSVAQGTVGWEVEMKRVLGEGDKLSQSSWQPGRKAGHSRCNVQTLRRKINRIPQRL